MFAKISFTRIQEVLHILHCEAKEVVRWIEDWDSVRKNPMERLSWSYRIEWSGGEYVMLHVDTNYPTDFAKILDDFHID